jgi:hypothetical protein
MSKNCPVVKTALRPRVFFSELISRNFICIQMNNRGGVDAWPHIVPNSRNQMFICLIARIFADISTARQI